MMSKVEARGKRRSARIVALEDKARALSLQKAESKCPSDSGNARCSASSSSAAATKNRKRGRKRKSLHDVHLGASAFPQEQEMTKSDDMSIKHGGLFVEANWPSKQLMPNKGALEFILDVLQRRDVQELFAEPVDPREVAGYYDVVKEPMDFGTMRAKLQEDMYTSLEQFERDVFLVFSNAMRFNLSNSVYYEVAEDLSILGQRLFHSLRTEPRNFDYIYTRTRQQMSNKAQGEAGGPLAKLVKRGGPRGVVSLSDCSNRTDERYLAPWHPKRYINQMTGKVAAGSREGSSFLSPGTERRNAYTCQISCLNKEKPIVSAVYNSPKVLTLASDTGMRYTESLNKFVEDLGPKVKAVADRKLGKQPDEALSCIWNPAFSSKPTNLLEPAAAYSFSGRGASGKLVHDGQIPGSFTANSSISFKGKMVSMDGSGMSSHSVLRRRQHPFSDYRSDSSAADKLAFRYSSRGGDGFSSRNLDIYGTSEEKTTAKIGNMDLLLATILQVSAIQNRNSRCPSGSYFPLTGNGPPTSGPLFPFLGKGGPLGFQPSQMWPPPSSSSKPVVISSSGAGKSQFTTFLRGVEPRCHQTGEGPSNAGGAYLLGQRLEGKYAYPEDLGQLSLWTTQGAASQTPDSKWVAVPPVGDQLKAASSRGKELFQATSMFDGATGGSGQQAKPWWMTYEVGCSSSGAGAAPPSLKIGHQQPDLSLQL